MRARSLGRCWVLGLALLAGCNNQYATRLNLTRQMTAVTKEAADLLATVHDQPTATAAAPKIKELADRMSDLGEKFEAFDTEDEIYFGQHEQTILEEHGKWAAEQSRLMQEELRIAKIDEARQALGESWIQLTGGVFDPGGPLAGAALDFPAPASGTAR